MGAFLIFPLSAPSPRCGSKCGHGSVGCGEERQAGSIPLCPLLDGATPSYHVSQTREFSWGSRGWIYVEEKQAQGLNYLD
jgi:hypothetical protein